MSELGLCKYFLDNAVCFMWALDCLCVLLEGAKMNTCIHIWRVANELKFWIEVILLNIRDWESLTENTQIVILTFPLCIIN